ncbi:MAG: hypothetical protein JSW07_04715, partial [bacterium]
MHTIKPDILHLKRIANELRIAIINMIYKPGSGFWVFTRFSDFSLRETFKAWTFGSSFSGVGG